MYQAPGFEVVSNLFRKKRDLGATSNYRGITLFPSGAKVYNRMILNRIRPHLDPLPKY